MDGVESYSAPEPSISNINSPDWYRSAEPKFFEAIKYWIGTSNEFGWESKTRKLFELKGKIIVGEEPLPQPHSKTNALDRFLNKFIENS